MQPEKNKKKNENCCKTNKFFASLLESKIKNIYISIIMILNTYLYLKFPNILNIFFITINFRTFCLITVIIYTDKLKWQKCLVTCDSKITSKLNH